VDLWSLGVVLFMLLGGYPPFYESGDDQKALYKKIVNASYNFHDEHWSGVSEEAKDLVRKLLVIDPTRRLAVDQALSHPWLRRARSDLVVRNLNTNMALMRSSRVNRFAKTAVLAGTSLAVDVVRKLSSAKGLNINEVAIDVIRKISSANVIGNDAVIEAARERSRERNLNSMGARK